VNKPGHLFVFEGADGVGKSRRCRQTAAFLQRLGVACQSFAFPGKTPGTLGLLVQKLQQSPAEVGLAPLLPETSQMLQVAVQLEGVAREMIPHLQEGKVLLVDRFWWSSWVYGMEMGADSRVMDALIGLARLAWRDMKPSCVFLIERDKPFRVEQSAKSFAALSSLYREIAKKESAAHPVHVISNEDFSTAQKRIEDVVRQTLNRRDYLVTEVGKT
jgi:dTMP kinase